MGEGEKRVQMFHFLGFGFWVSSWQMKLDGEIEKKEWAKKRSCDRQKGRSPESNNTG